MTSVEDAMVDERIQSIIKKFLQYLFLIAKSATDGIVSYIVNSGFHTGSGGVV
jgi:hypothetical protein